ncbi:hypothetical protein ANN_06733 [Periplaneta americana]|uniref:Tc1-like transposase DDE domain-containing protein n=1 Tax=Periplaneta americana TaxID=6978 RepID=A0ABQ8TG90_PERAM|nr:hypothetical protein ANN_06733 [Periplaneta americana]
MDSLRTQSGQDDQKTCSGEWADWSGNSPDLNPVEHIWSRLQDSVFRAPTPRYRVELVTLMQGEWDSVNQEDTFKLNESLGGV